MQSSSASSTSASHCAQLQTSIPCSALTPLWNSVYYTISSKCTNHYSQQKIFASSSFVTLGILIVESRYSVVKCSRVCDARAVRVPQSLSATGKCRHPLSINVRFTPFCFQFAYGNTVFVVKRVKCCNGVIKCRECRPQMSTACWNNVQCSTKYRQVIRNVSVMCAL